MLVYTNGCSHSANRGTGWPAQLMNALCGVRNYSHHEMNSFMNNIFEVSVDWVEKFSELKKQIENPVHNLIDSADHGKSNQKIYIETIDWVTRLMKINKKPHLVVIQWSGPERKLDYNYDDALTYDYDKHKEIFYHSIDINPHDSFSRGLIPEPLASKMTIQYMLLLQSFLKSHNIEYAFIPYMKLQSDEFVQPELRYLDKRKLTTDLFKGHRDDFRRRCIVEDYNGHPNLISSNEIVDKVLDIINLSEFKTGYGILEMENALNHYREENKMFKNIKKNYNKLNDGEESILNKLFKPLL